MEEELKLPPEQLQPTQPTGELPALLLHKLKVVLPILAQSIVFGILGQHGGNVQSLVEEDLKPQQDQFKFKLLIMVSIVLEHHPKPKLVVLKIVLLIVFGLHGPILALVQRLVGQELKQEQGHKHLLLPMEVMIALEIHLKPKIVIHKDVLFLVHGLFGQIGDLVL